MHVTTEMITITAENDESFQAYIAKPNDNEDLQAPVVIVIQEIFGVNGVMRSICDGLAYQGYIAVCPDLFWRQEAGVDITDKTEEEWAKAIALYQGFDESKGIEDLKTTLSYMRKHKNSSGKVGTIGYCLGGKLAYLMAMRSDSDCNVCYYGVGIQDAIAGVVNIKNPLMLHIAGNDQFVDKDAQKIIIDGVAPYEHIEAYHYKDVGHAFARMGGDHYDEDAANSANFRTSDFLARCLVGDEEIS